PLSEGLAKLREFRNWRAEEMGRRLEKHGVRDAYQGALKYCKGNIISRTHFARYLVEQGFGKDMRKVFKHFLRTNKPGYVPGDWASLEEAVGWITECGGQAVVAHPARYDMSATKLRRLLGEFKECGGEAMEVVSGSHSRDDCKNMATHAQRIGLRASAGSDYHGPENPWVELGRLADLPDSCEPVWESETWPALEADNKKGEQ
ncbi:MAG: PHP domain-containing protein, partial [Gammaproteobacteria bacterium]|nr:PHP domain-containing protein [Gammaproteobacteria bacterium]